MNTPNDNQRLADAIFGPDSDEAKSMRQATQPQPQQGNLQEQLDDEAQREAFELGFKAGIQQGKQQRDELLAASKEALKSLEYAAAALDVPARSTFSENIIDLRTAIANAKKE